MKFPQTLCVVVLPANMRSLNKSNVKNETIGIQQLYLSTWLKIQKKKKKSFYSQHKWAFVINKVIKCTKSPVYRTFSRVWQSSNSVDCLQTHFVALNSLNQYQTQVARSWCTFLLGEKVDDFSRADRYHLRIRGDFTGVLIMWTET